ncbi:hypothetical protein [Latilactobacillus fragifolii]|uniref:hypothetical protein n=1 Tax=Latilactobacillus fragifolii TaxID=2814244 RepID=UPI001ABADE67|nr:hypothetical protein [Latilactobacillus fragifolii]
MKLIKKIQQSVVSGWHGYLGWWNTIPQAILAKRLITLYQLTFGCLKVLIIYFLFGIPVRYFIQDKLFLPSAKLHNLIAIYSLLLVLVWLSCITRGFKKKYLKEAVSLFGLTCYPAVFYLNFSGQMILNILGELFVTSILIFLIIIIIQIIKLLITKSINKDMTFDKSNPTQKIFNKSSVWHEYERMTNPPKSAKCVKVSADKADEDNSNLPLYPESVNTNEYVARQARLPAELIEHAKQLDDLGIYSLPTLKLQTNFPIRFTLEVPID